MSCDCEHPDVYSAKVVRVRKPHKCVECCCPISVKESAEKVDALWDGQFQTIYTCTNCTKIRKFIEEKFPEDCLCHGELSEFLWNSGFLYSETEIEEETAEWAQNYDSSVGVVMGPNSVIATHVPWLVYKNGKFCLVAEQWEEECH